MAVLNGAEIEKSLARIPAWRCTGSALTREFLFPSFSDAIEFVTRLAQVAEAVDHHPDIIIEYRKVTLNLWTHSEGGVTGKDLDLAARIDGL